MIAAPQPIQKPHTIVVAEYIMAQCGKKTQQCPALFKATVNSCKVKAGVVTCQVVARPKASPMIYCRGTLEYQVLNKKQLKFRFPAMKCGRS